MILSYELAKELKDAGFPRMNRGPLWNVQSPDETERLFFPSLEELIEACGADFSMLAQRNEDQCWGAVAMRRSPRGYFDERGSTPTEAVARLWLALHKK